MSSSNNAHDLDWQNEIDTVQDSMKHLLETGLDADVQFSVGTGKQLPDGREEKQLFNAHRFILVARSSVFAAQFRFNKSSGQDNDAPIEVIDISASAFNAMLQYLYTNEISLINKENYVQVYYAAKKYLLNALVRKCIGLIGAMLVEKNVFDMLRMAKLHEETALIKHCWAFIDRGIDHFDFQSFFALSHDEMGEILGRDSLRCHEGRLYFSLEVWAKKQCENEGILESTGEQLRAKMGELLYAIRFPLISPMCFINYIVPKGILNNSEIAAIFLCYAEDADEEVKKDNPLPFPTKPRAIDPEYNTFLYKLVAEFRRENEQFGWRQRGGKRGGGEGMRGRGGVYRRIF